MVYTIELVRLLYESHIDAPNYHNPIHIAFPICWHNTKSVQWLVSISPLTYLISYSSIPPPRLYTITVVAFVPLLRYRLSPEFNVRPLVHKTSGETYLRILFLMCDIVRRVPLTLMHPAHPTLQRNTKISFESGLPAQ